MFFTGEAELRDDWIFKCCRISNEFQPDYAKCRYNTLEVRAGGAAFRCTLTWMHLFLPFPTFYWNHLHGGRQRYETELFTENRTRDNKPRFNRFFFLDLLPSVWKSDTSDLHHWVPHWAFSCSSHRSRKCKHIQVRMRVLIVYLLVYLLNN